MTDRTVRADCGGISMGWNCTVTTHMPKGSDAWQMLPTPSRSLPRLPPGSRGETRVYKCVCELGGGSGGWGVGGDGEEGTEGFIWQGVKKMACFFLLVFCDGGGRY